MKALENGLKYAQTLGQAAAAVGTMVDAFIGETSSADEGKGTVSSQAARRSCTALTGSEEGSQPSTGEPATGELGWVSKHLGVDHRDEDQGRRRLTTRCLTASAM